MQNQSKPRIAISIGDFNGIGPEIILKTLSATDLENSIPVIVSPKPIIEQALSALGNVPIHIADQISDINNEVINVLTIDAGEVKLSPGLQSIESGKVAMQSIEKCVDLCVSGETQAMVTAPISKESVNLAGYKIPGHTEFLASQTQTDHVLMMLVSGNLRVALVTTHIPVNEVSKAVTPETIKIKLEILINSLKHDFSIEHPKIAIFGLNPHAGDGGVIGNEEIDTIAPVIKSMQAAHKDVNLNGPFPADGFFGQKLHQKHDAILAMYHDQGLAPFKLLSFGKGVNFTAGLPIIRTSPDHGTAFDIAGKGVANPSSFKEAYDLAVELANKRIHEN